LSGLFLSDRQRVPCPRGGRTCGRALRHGEHHLAVGSRAQVALVLPGDEAGLSESVCASSGGRSRRGRSAGGASTTGRASRARPVWPRRRPSAAPVARRAPGLCGV